MHHGTDSHLRVENFASKKDLTDTVAQAISGVYKFKGSVNFAELPFESMKAGDHTTSRMNLRLRIYLLTVQERIILREPMLLIWVRVGTVLQESMIFQISY